MTDSVLATSNDSYTTDVGYSTDSIVTNSAIIPAYFNNSEEGFWLSSYYEDIENEIKVYGIVFQVYLPPVLIFLGSVGNILTIIIMKRKQFHHYSVSLYVSLYAVCSILMLYLFLGSEWIANLTNEKSIDARADWLCRVWQFISRVISFAGIWFVVAMLIDRYIVIWHSKKAITLCTIFMAKFASIIIFVGLIVISIHAMWTFELMENSGCFIFHQVGDIHALIWPWLSASFYSFIPLTLIFVFNVLITTGLCLKLPSKAHQRVEENISLVLTYTTLGLSTLYFILVLPPTIINVIDMTYPPSWIQDRQLMLQLAKARYISHYMAWINTVIVFSVCFVFSRTFRKSFKEMMTSTVCLRHLHRIYEIQTEPASTGIEFKDACTETTPI